MHCDTCQHWNSMNNGKGLCQYLMPPIVERIYAMLHGEPATHIDWNKQAAELPVTSAHYGCSEHKPKL